MMAWSERRYGNEIPEGRLGAFPVGTAIVVGVTLAVSLLIWGFTGGSYSEGAQRINAAGSISVPSLLDFEVWRLVTSWLLHANTSHLLSNMIIALLIGLFLESLVGTKGLIKMYVGLAIAAGLTVFLKPIVTPDSAAAESIGASGAIMGLVVFFGSRFARLRIYLFGIVPLPAWVYATILVSADVIALVAGDSPNTDHVVHLGGAFSGFALGFLWPRVQQRWDWRQGQLKVARRRRQQERDQEDRTELDRILQKINQEGGMHRLTERERRFLVQQSDRLKGRKG